MLGVFERERDGMRETVRACVCVRVCVCAYVCVKGQSLFILLYCPELYGWSCCFSFCIPAGNSAIVDKRTDRQSPCALCNLMCGLQSWNACRVD